VPSFGRIRRGALYAGGTLPLGLAAGRLSQPTVRRAYREFLPWSWRREPLLPDTTYVFAFLGEFGYELLNWQGVVRKLGPQLPPSSDVVVGGRRGLEPFYRSASQYVDISALPPFVESVAAAYFALPPTETKRRAPPTIDELAFDERLRGDIARYVVERIDRPDRRLRFVFSSSLTPLGSCLFGVDRAFYAGDRPPGAIYKPRGIVENNVYERIRSEPAARADVETQLGWSLDEPYVLVQTRRRAIGPQSGGGVDESVLVAELAKRVRTITLSFATGRRLDSGSSIASPGEAIEFRAQSFREQAALIEHARACVFFTEGDLGSHTYLPPLMGRDVYVVASQGVFDRPSAPLDFWNRSIFRVGGQMIPWVAERVLASPEAARAAAASVVPSPSGRGLG